MSMESINDQTIQEFKDRIGARNTIILGDNFTPELKRRHIKEIREDLSIIIKFEEEEKNVKLSFLGIDGKFKKVVIEKPVYFCMTKSVDIHHESIEFFGKGGYEGKSFDSLSINIYEQKSLMIKQLIINGKKIRIC